MESRPEPLRYRIAVHRAGGGYVARALAVPGCDGRGVTAVEAIENARAAIRAWVATSRTLVGERVVVELEISA